MQRYRRRLRRGRGSRSAAFVRRRVRLGRSARGRQIEAVEVGDPSSLHKILVVGAIHGDETAGIRLARRLGRGSAPAGVDMWLVDDLNPDGTAAHTRQNAHGVDLNRNFPWHWRRIGSRGDQQYSGLRGLSEPETRIARALIRRVRPRITIWFHQPLALVDRSGGNVGIERRFATAFVVELPPGRLTAHRLERYAHAVIAIVRQPAHGQ
jgi:protein MpaA